MPEELQSALRRVSGTTLESQGAANVWAGTDGVTTATRTNLCPNPVLANDLVSWAYNAGTGGAISFSRITNCDGPMAQTAARLTWTTAPNSNVSCGIYMGSTGSSVLPVTPGLSYAASAWVRASKAQLLTARIYFYDSTGVLVQGFASPNMWVNPGEWTLLKSAPAVAPANSARVLVLFYTWAGTSYTDWQVGDWLDVQGGLFEQSTTVGDYFDGNRAVSPYARVAWTGTPHASTSTATRSSPQALDLLGALNAKNGTTSLGLQAVLNSLAGTSGLGVRGAAEYLGGPYSLPNLELALETDRLSTGQNLLSADVANVRNSVWTPTGATASITVSDDTASPILGTHSLKLAYAAGASNTTGAGAFNGYVACNPGDTFYISALAKLVSGTAAGWRLTARWGDVSNAFIIENAVTTATLSATPAWIGATITAPANARTLTLKVYGPAAPAAGDTALFDCFGVYASSTPVTWSPPGGFQDGDSIPVWADRSGKGRDVMQSDQTKMPKYRSANPNILSYSDAMAYSTASPQGGASVTVDTTGVIDGPNSYKSVMGASPATNSGVIAGITPSNPVTVGKTYSSSVKVKQTVGSGQLYFQVIWRNDAGTLTGSVSTGAVTLPANQVATLTINNVVPPAGTTCATYKVLTIAADPTGDTFYCGAWMLNEGATALPFVRPVKLPSSKPVVQLDGLNDTLTLPGVAPAILNADLTDGLTVYVVHTVDAMPDGTTRSLVSTTSGNNGWAIGVNATNRINAYAYAVSGAALTAVASVPPVAGATDVASGVYDVNQIRSYFNGGAPAGSTGRSEYVTAAGSLAIGSSDSTARFVTGSVLAVYVYSTAHSDATRSRVEKWLGNKYGITVS